MHDPEHDPYIDRHKEIFQMNKTCLLCGYTYHCQYCQPWPFEAHICQPELPFIEEVEITGDEF